MAKKDLNNNLNKAKSEKNDEFYTQLTDIEKELGHYKKHFKNKTVFCNCDDPEESNFWNYFALNFEFLGLKKLVSTHYEKEKPSYKLEIIKDINADGKINKLDTIKTKLKQNGDFRSPECVEILKEADIVITNPPFSLFREYVAQLMEYEKKFVIIGSLNAITYKEIFKLIKANKIWLGFKSTSQSMFFKTKNEEYANRVSSTRPEGSWWRNINGQVHIGINNSCWFTNLDIKKRHEDAILYRTYNSNDYPKYDNYNAINVNTIKDIPMDYKGAIGVPITFLDKYNPEQFEIVRFRKGDDEKDLNINGKHPYFRILIKNKRLQ
jgi:hypothetical protein